MSDDQPNDLPPERRPLQFRLRTLLIATAVAAAILSALSWLEAPPRVQIVVLAVLSLGAITAIGLLAVIASGEP